MTATEAAAAGSIDDLTPALQVEHLEVVHRVRGQDRRALRDVSFQIGRQESYGLVGESGSGKSTVALALTRYLPGNGRVTEGRISINGQDTLAMDAAALRTLRARTVSMVYQEPGRALNPSIKVGHQVAEVYEIAGLDHHAAMDRSEAMLAHGPDLRSGPGHGAVPASDLRRDGAAGRHRDGPGLRAVAADPRRADHGA